MAVFTPVSPDEAQTFLDRYGVGALEALEPIAEGVENTNFRLTAGGKTYVLTLFEKRVRPQDLPFFLGLMDHLAGKDYPAPQPIAGHDGRWARTLNDRPAALIEFLPGRWKKAHGPGEYEAAGAALARLHLAAADFDRRLPNAFGLASWAKLAEACALKAKGEEARIVAALWPEIDALAAAWPDDLPQGVIHADYFPDNVLFEGPRVSGVIDYYFACDEALAYDLAIAVNAWCFDAEGGYLPEAAARFCRGYANVRPLTKAESEAFPILARGAAVRFTLTRLYDLIHHDPSWIVTPKDPRPFLKRLDWHQQARDGSAYGLASAA